MLVRVNNLLKNKSVTALSANDELPVMVASSIMHLNGFLD